MKFCILGSGSRGNAVAVWNGDGRGVLIDAGFNHRQLIRRMRLRDINPAWFEAVLVTHAHGDHVAGLRLWCLERATPIYGSAGTDEWLGTRESITIPKPHECHARSCWKCQLADFMQSHPSIYIAVELRRPFDVAGFRVLPYPVVHNAPKALNFSLECGGKKIAMMFETGRITKDMAREAEGADALLLESNHDVRMLATNENYPDFLIERVGVTHLSNDDAAGVLRKLPARTRTVVLMHLSEQNNHPGLAMDVANQALLETGRAEVQLHVAAQDEPSEIIEV